LAFTLDAGLLFSSRASKPGHIQAKNTLPTARGSTAITLATPTNSQSYDFKYLIVVMLYVHVLFPFCVLHELVRICNIKITFVDLAELL
jgi:hypothetical protein